MDDVINVYLTCGLPGSGKTTWAREFIEKNPNTIRICRDSIREMFCGSYKYNKETEPIVKRAAIELIDLAIGNKRNIIIDETNIRKSKREDWIDILKMIEHEIYEKIKIHIVYFPLGIEIHYVNSNDNLENRMTDDPRGYSREHWEKVINSMKEDFEIPIASEFPEGVGLVEVR